MVPLPPKRAAEGPQTFVRFFYRPLVLEKFTQCAPSRSTNLYRFVNGVSVREVLASDEKHLCSGVGTCRVSHVSCPSPACAFLQKHYGSPSIRLPFRKQITVGNLLTETDDPRDLRLPGIEPETSRTQSQSGQTNTRQKKFNEDNARSELISFV